MKIDFCFRITNPNILSPAPLCCGDEDYLYFIPLDEKLLFLNKLQG